MVLEQMVLGKSALEPVLEQIFLEQMFVEQMFS